MCNRPEIMFLCVGLSIVVGLQGLFLTRPYRLNWEIAKKKEKTDQGSSVPCPMRENNSHRFEQEFRSEEESNRPFSSKQRRNRGIAAADALVD